MGLDCRFIVGPPKPTKRKKVLKLYIISTIDTWKKMLIHYFYLVERAKILTAIIKSIHFKETVAQISFLWKLWYFQCRSNKCHNFERNKIHSTGFLKWTDFNELIILITSLGQSLLQHAVINFDTWYHPSILTHSL